MNPLFRVALPVYCVLALIGVELLRGDVVLIEFLANNTKGLKDADGEFSDWIEIHNTGSLRVNLVDWALTDDPRLPGKWLFPSTNLEAGSYLVVFASGKDRARAGAELHTSFSLDANGEYLALFPPESAASATEFSPSFPPQKPDISYGFRDGKLYFFPSPSPRAVNSGGFENFVADTKFSSDRGFYTAPFELTISCATPGAVIRYTTNGAPPTANSGIIFSKPIGIDRTVVVRAAAFKTDLQPSGVDTQTYLFIEDILRQSVDGRAPSGWPTSWGGNTVDYGMDPDIVNGVRYKDRIRNDLKALPSFCVVTELKNLFDSQSGIYSHADQDGRDWERPCSLELVYPDGRKGFQVNSGIRIRGGFSRSGGNPKHAFRFFFREQYGVSKLRFPLLGNNGTDTFDALDLRTFQNYSWSFQGDRNGVFIRDQFSRDAQLAMGQQGERGDFYHLYINGQYWGIYNTCERPEASYGATYFGGQKEDYDVIKVETTSGYNINATDGNLDAWRRLYNIAKTGFTNNEAAYFRIQGLNADGTPNSMFENLLEMDNLIDYMLVILYGGNIDAPISNFLGNESPNNWYGLRNRTGQNGGFRFMAHDAEHTLLPWNATIDRTGPYSAGNSGISKSNPQWIFQRLWASAEFRIRCADRVHKHLFNNGALTDASALKLFEERIRQLDPAIVAESARWGDAKVSPPINREDWLAAVAAVRTGFIRGRTALVVTQLRKHDLYPVTVAPAFNQHGGPVVKGFQATVTAPAGTRYYTTDGSDPRLIGGAVAPAARAYSEAIAVDETTTIRSRARVGSVWSALNEAAFTVIQNFAELFITEIQYNPVGGGGQDGDNFEFLELKNVGSATLDLSGVQITNAIQYTFPIGTRLAAGQFAVLVSNSDAFTNRYPGRAFAGVYQGHLANSSESISVVHATGMPIFEVNYSDASPWPQSADGLGFSLVPLNANLNPDPNNPAHWRASSLAGGSPGADDPPVNLPAVLINEVLTHSSSPQGDAVELFNPGPAVADIGGWYLTDDRVHARKFRIPNGTRIEPGAYRVFTETDYNSAAAGTNAFAFNFHGDDVFLYSADAAGNLTGYSDGFSFGAAALGESFGRYTNSAGSLQFVAQISSSLGRANSGPAFGPVVFSEINYAPAPGGVEFVEILNTSSAPVSLFDPDHTTNNWRIDGLNFVFPPGVILPPNGLAVVVASDPILFRAFAGIPETVPVFGPFAGSLQDSGELLELQRPDMPDFETNGVVVKTIVPYLGVDAVRYENRTPWPPAAGGGGSSLERAIPLAYGNDPAAWKASSGLPSPGTPNNGNRPPRADAGQDQQVSLSSFPTSVPLHGFASDDGLPLLPGKLSYQWSQVAGPAGAVFGNSPTGSSQAQPSVALPGVGSYTFRLTVSDGERTASDDVSVSVTRPGFDGVLFPFESTWKYFDQRADQGTAWRAVDFDDSLWKTGKARLGYGDAANTTIQGGPAGQRYPTAYFRRKFTVTNRTRITEATAWLIRDDGGVVYINGKEAFRNNMREGDIGFEDPASNVVGNADEVTPVDTLIDPSLFRDGENTVAVEIHQQNPGSSDLGFDLQINIVSQPVNLAPTVNVGPDITAARVHDGLWLNANYTEDGLPTIPGAPTFAWSTVSGPGTVTFDTANSPRTIARFSSGGIYVLRLRVNDGALSAADELTVSVQEDASSVVLTALAGDPVRLRFEAVEGQAYVIEYRESLAAGSWTPLKAVPAGSSRSIEITEVPSSAARYYRVIFQPN
ncbi:MAG: hypothetical protein EXS36_09950 [Pedosphaera sp.]|nr:hypothetical protein [Pedosphaera sp.]